MPTIDAQLHWYPQKFLESCLDRTSFPRCKQNGDGFSYEIADELHRHRVSSGDSLVWGEHDQAIGTQHRGDHVRALGSVCR